MNDETRLLKEIIQSANINFLIGAGASTPFLPVLGAIEKKIEAATSDKEILACKKQYFKNAMYPCCAVNNKGEDLDATGKASLETTYSGYKVFFDLVNRILLKRKGPLLNKQANVFTTNIDTFMEKVLEDLGLEYNDGFSGNIEPTFQTSNFHKSIYKTSEHFGNISEIPTFNIIKIHGSLSWEMSPGKEKIAYSRLELLPIIEASMGNDAEFTELYDKLSIVNPSKAKFKQTVMGVTYYELLRMYSNELEKENSVLFVLGFSMADEHIREITLRAANSNPTLAVYIFTFRGCADAEKCKIKLVEDKCTYHKCLSWFGSMKYKNVRIIGPDATRNFDIKAITNEYLATVLASEDDLSTGEEIKSRKRKETAKPEGK